jgi:argininosuccinate lyase/amino-acid N-acetyltransferase
MTVRKLWGGRFETGPSELLRQFNDSFSFDHQLFKVDVEGSVAWARALEKIGVLSSDEAEAIVSALQAVPAPVAASLGDYEDVHSYVESKLYEKLGAVAGKLHTGRSRNDQVATDLRLWLKRACDDAVALTRDLAVVLATRARDEAATPMPGYTHSKQAEPITFGHWTLAYVEMLTRDLDRFESAHDRGDECPLGSGALAGTPLNLDREALAKSLGFARPTANSVDGVADRDFAVEYLFCATLLLSHLSRLAEDVIFFTSDEAGYAELPDALATGSSRMPQKKNPDVLELVRGHAARSIGELTGLLALMKGLPLAYDKDLQLDKEPLFRTYATLHAALPALTALMADLKLDREKLRAAAASPLLLATDAADELAAKGIPFREAHEIVGRNRQQSFNPIETILAKKSAFGGTSPERVREAAERVLERLQ